MKKNLLLMAVIILISSFDVAAQTLSVTGQVLSAEDNEPLPGVNVVIKGTTTGTVTDLDGNYSLQAGAGEILVFICWF